MADITNKPLAHQAYELCIEIEKLPSSEQQTACSTLASALLEKLAALDDDEPIPMILHCPKCRYQHVDAPDPDSGWTNPPHRTHLCHACGHLWRPANVSTVGVGELPPPPEEDDG